MKNALPVLKVELRRSVCSGTFLLQLGLTLLWMYLNCLQNLSSEHGARGMFLMNLLDNALANVLSFSHLLLVLGTVSFSWSYCTDLSCGYGNEVVRRVGARPYGVSKTVAVAVSSFSATGAAILLFTAVALLYGFPWSAPASSYSNAYMSLVANGGLLGGLAYLAARCLVIGTSCSFAAVVSLSVSAYIRNIYASMMMPVLLYFVFEILVIAGRFSLMTVIFGQAFPGEPLRSLVWALLYLTVLILAFGKLFLYKIEKEFRP